MHYTGMSLKSTWVFKEDRKVSHIQVKIKYSSKKIKCNLKAGQSDISRSYLSESLNKIFTND